MAASADPAASCEAYLGHGPFVWRLDSLEAAKASIGSDRPETRAAYAKLMEEAELALTAGPFSVTDKQRPPPSGDLHDYTSLAPYWWPDPAKSDGKPYIRRDGEVNPEREGVNFDRRRSQDMAEAVETLTLAAYFSGEARYADRAAFLLETWFVAPETRMNPNLNYGQSIPGRTDGRGIGIIDTSFYLPVVDSIRILRLGGHLPDETYQGLKAWFADYARWLVESPLGQDERAAKNNHGTYYDLQLAAFAMLAGDCALPVRVFQDTRARLRAQITKGGRMPLEERRTRSLHYYVFNTFAFMNTARLAEHFGQDLYGFVDDEGVGFLDTVGLLAEYSGRETRWPHQMIGNPADRDLWRLFKQALVIVEAPSLVAAERRASGRDMSDRTVLISHPIVEGSGPSP